MIGPQDQSRWLNGHCIDFATQRPRGRTRSAAADKGVGAQHTLYTTVLACYDPAVFILDGVTERIGFRPVVR